MNNNNTNINNNGISSSLDNINKIYDNLSYFDLYGNSVIIFILITLLVFIVFSYCRIMQNKQEIANDWANQRCKPQYMLFAGLITEPKNTSYFQYTSDNFQFCVQNILKTVSQDSFRPFEFMISSLTKIFSAIANSIQEVRVIIDRLRNTFKEFAQDVFGRILNVLIPIQKIFIVLMDTFHKIQGTMTTALYTMLGSYFTLQALMGAILELIIKILMALAIIIVGLWVMPFTWPAAASMTAVFLGISIPLSIIVYFMSEVLHIKSSSIPKLRCFDENTMIEMLDGTFCAIKNVSVGDKLADGGYITSKFKISAIDLKIYNLHNIIVSENHLVKYGDKWICVKDHPYSLEINFSKPYLYCLNTSNKIICLNGLEFSDWDEIQVNNFDNTQSDINTLRTLVDFHECLDEGFEETTIIKLNNNKVKQINKIEIGDILENDSVVYGVVEVDGKKLRNKFKGISDKLYHLLTHDGNLYINSVNVKDYNNIIDKFII